MKSREGRYVSACRVADDEAAERFASLPKPAQIRSLHRPKESEQPAHHGVDEVLHFRSANVR
jgi:hypothetical protein